MRKHSNIIAIHTHKYAPELNTVFLSSGVSLPAPGITLMTEVKGVHGFFKTAKKGRYVTIQYVNKTNQSLNRFYSGYIKSYEELNAFLNGRKEYHNVPGGYFKTSIKYIG